MKKAKSTAVPKHVVFRFPNVKRVVEAKHPIILEVTKEDVKNSVKLDGGMCAMANAICRAEHADGAIVGLATTYVVRGTTAFRYRTGEAVAREIVSFDRNHDFAPGEYKISAQAPTQTLAALKIRDAKRQSEARRRAAGTDSDSLRPRKRHDSAKKHRIVTTHPARVRKIGSFKVA